ncbi:MAG TPA: hypothetical protein VEB86_17100 [Chryseosolibacter sp.]|nr:hypothetical protein [Chryseosolibacter sp.]
MTLHSTIKKINNDLISVYAVLDSYCDADFYLGGNAASLHRTVCEHLAVGGYVLSQAVRMSDVQTSAKTDAIIDTLEMPGDVRREALSELSHLNAAKLRFHLREQLYQMLRTLDRVQVDQRLQDNVRAQVVQMFAGLTVYGNETIAKHTLEIG